jgi:hypothetical protein
MVTLNVRWISMTFWASLAHRQLVTAAWVRLSVVAQRTKLRIPEASSCRYWGIILRSDLSWPDHVNYTVHKAWKALQTVCKRKRQNLQIIWETLAQRRKKASICALCKAYTGERAWKSIGDRLNGPCYLSRDDHDGKIRARKQRTDIGNYSFVNRTIKLEPTACRGTSYFPM